jgi:VCBS repeat-containing protein
MASTSWGTPPTGNVAPVAVDDSYTTAQDTPLSVPAPGVLANDSDADSDPLTAVQLSSAVNGEAALNADGSFSYTPNTGFTGTDSFTYEAHDNNGGVSASATVTISVTGAMACVDYPDKGSCQNDPTCEWQGRPKTGSCVDAAVCTPTETTEVSCNDGADNHCDGDVDCADSDCSGDTTCQVDCSTFGDKNSCNAQTTCHWDNKSKTCL